MKGLENMADKKDTRCPVKIPLALMVELRKIKAEKCNTIIGAILLLINFYKDNK